MTFVNITNAPVSIQLAASQSTTVPVGQVWNVTVAAAQATSSNTYAEGVTINGKKLLTTRVYQGDTNSGTPNASVKIIAKAGDVIATTQYITADISGFVVQQA